jgi:uncharacterized protein (DUF952 family)
MIKKSLAETLSEHADELGIKEIKFEPMDVQKLPHLYTVSDVQIEAVVREAKISKNVIYAIGMFAALELLGLPS